MANPGDTVRVITPDDSVEGILLPSASQDVVLIKLDNGYNVGIESKNIRKMVLLEEGKKGSSSLPLRSPAQKGLPTLTILHTGGTIASKVDYKTGGVYAGFSAEDFIEMFPEIKTIANVRTRHVANLMSEDMRFSHYQLLAKAVKEEIEQGCAGVIIGHGTDTLAVTSAALSFMFENLSVPVIIVGSQRSTDRGSSDAAMNLLSAARFIVGSDFAGVGICMHATSSDEYCHIFPATKTRKMHTSRRDAFKAINDKPIARVHYPSGEITFLKEYVKKSEVQGKLVLRDKLEEKVAVVKTYPNMSPVIVNALVDAGFKGIILEATGIGQAPTNIAENLPNYEALKKFIAQGGVVVLTSQCIFGRVHADIYSNCRRLKEIGVIFGEDMLTETALVKLAWLLGNYPQKEAEKLVAENLRGEISLRSEYEKEFI